MHEHLWSIFAIRGMALATATGEEVPISLHADLRCSSPSCTAEVYGLSIEQLRALISAGHILGASLAQWASISALFR